MVRLFPAMCSAACLLHASALFRCRRIPCPRRRGSDPGGDVCDDHRGAAERMAFCAVVGRLLHFLGANPISFVVDHSGDMTAYFEQDPPAPPHDPDIIYDDSGCPQYQNCHSPIVLNVGKGGYELTGKDDP